MNIGMVAPAAAALQVAADSKPVEVEVVEWKPRVWMTGFDSLVAKGAAGVGVQGRGQAERLQDWTCWCNTLLVGHSLGVEEGDGFVRAIVAEKAD